MTLTLEVVRPDGKIVRTYTSAENKKFKTWEGGPAPATPLPAKAGLNRFNWDLRVDSVPAVKNVFVMGSHEGPRVVPGEYTLRLSADQEGLDPVERSDQPGLVVL